MVPQELPARFGINVFFTKIFFRSVEIIVFHNVLGGVCHSPQGRANWRRCPDGHLRYATVKEHEKTSVGMSSSYIAPATAALKKRSDDHFYESTIL
ncbi:MAG: hypothetical protein OS112_04615 [Methanoregula sp.]|nr:MAG: hypothetical protein OS112_04615 [Methanoregula sp.]